METTKMIDNLNITVTGGELPDEESKQYIIRGKAKFGKHLQDIDIKVDGEYVELTYDVPVAKYQRIRRITGYLVGSLDRFNNGKRAEEHDRVKHGIDPSKE